jgi:hypothetical protein
VPPKIAILGGYGNAAMATARLLLAETGASVVLAGRSLEKARAAAALLAAQFGAARVSAARADGLDPASLAEVLRGAAMLLVASPTIENTGAVAEAALAAGVDYFDLQLSSRRKLEPLEALRPRIEAAGRSFITDGGYHPGVPAALVRYAALSFDEMHSAMTGSVMKIDWGAHTFSDAAMREFAEEMREYRPACFLDGKWKESWSVSRVFDFGPPFGKQKTRPMMLAEMSELPACYPSLRETGFLVAGFDPVTDNVFLPLIVALLKLAPSKPMLAGRLFRWSASRFARPPFHLTVQLEASGIREGRPFQMRVRVSHPDPYVFTAAPVVACLKQYLDGSIRKPGLHLQANVVEPVRFLRDLAGMGVAVT